MPLLSLFSSKTLGKLITGEVDIPIGLLKKVTVYKGITVDSGTFGLTVQSVDYLAGLGHGLGPVELGPGLGPVWVGVKPKKRLCEMVLGGFDRFLPRRASIISSICMGTDAATPDRW